MFEIPEAVEPGEAMLAVVGLRPLLEKTAARIPADDWKIIYGIAKKCDSLARDLVDGSLKSSQPPSIDYDGLLDAFTEPFDTSALDPMLKEIPLALHDAISSFVGTAAKAMAYLEGKFPISVVKTVCGTVNLPPSDFAIGMFEDLLEVVDKPLNVYGMVAVGRLTSDQALALETIYPELYALIVASIVDRIIRAKTALADPNDWYCEFERGLAVLLSVPGLDPSIKSALALPATNQPQTNQAAQSRPPQKAPATNTATASQKVDNALQNG